MDNKEKTAAMAAREEDWLQTINASEFGVSSRTELCIRTLCRFERFRSEFLRFIESYYKGYPDEEERLKRIRENQHKMERGFGRIHEVLKAKLSNSMCKGISESYKQGTELYI